MVYLRSPCFSRNLCHWMQEEECSKVKSSVIFFLTIICLKGGTDLLAMLVWALTCEACIDRMLRFFPIRNKFCTIHTHFQKVDTSEIKEYLKELVLNDKIRSLGLLKFHTNINMSIYFLICRFTILKKCNKMVGRSSIVPIWTDS